MSKSALHPLLQELAGTDRRSTGHADRVAELIADAPEQFAIVFDGMANPDAVIRMRAADAVEKASRQSPELLQTHKEQLLREMVNITQIEVRWHVAQMLPRLELDAQERSETLSILEAWLDDDSQIVRVNAIQALVELVAQDESLRPRIEQKLAALSTDPSPAVRARVRKLHRA